MSGAIGLAVACVATLAAALIVFSQLIKLGARWPAYALVAMEASLAISIMLTFAASDSIPGWTVLLSIPLTLAVVLIPAERLRQITGGPVSIESLIDAIVSFESRLEEQPTLSTEEVDARLEQIRSVAPIQARRFVRLLALITRHTVLGTPVADINALRRDYALEHERVIGWWQQAQRR